MRWCFDTSALIEPWVRRYPRDVFGPMWDALAIAAQDGLIAAPVDVRLELERQSDELCDWVKGLPNFFLEADRAVLVKFTEIVNDHPGFMKVDSTKSGADPVVVAMAAVRGVPVVTYETMAKKGAAPKMPNVCEACGVECVSIVDVLRGIGFKF